MATEALSPQELVRRAVIEVAGLPEKDLVVVLEVVADLKHQARTERRAQVAGVMARARQMAAELRNLPREELWARFRATLDEMRAQAIAQGTVGGRAV